MADGLRSTTIHRGSLLCDISSTVTVCLCVGVLLVRQPLFHHLYTSEACVAVYCYPDDKIHQQQS